MNIPNSRAHTLANQGIQAASQGDLKQAVKHYNAALKLFEKAGATADIAPVIGNRAAARAGLGQVLEALEDYRQAMAYHRSIHDRARMASTLTNFGQLTLSIGALTAATRHLDEAIALHSELGSDLYAAFTLAIRANATRAGGDLEGAAAQLSQAEAALKLCGEPVLGAVARGARAMADLEDGRVGEALSGFEEALPLLEGRFEEPHAHYLMGYGEALARMGDERTGIAMVQAAEQQVRSRDWPLGKALAHNTRARMLARAGRHGAARESWLRAKGVATALSAGPASPLGQDLLRTEASVAGSATDPR
ncbi:MAG: hypothetical protein GWP91_02495 [Rhodobacterales bacterium]|nr:hypothetical protein [Rhodobacterales bacterium]